jgi:hypothetical protein
MMRNLNEKQRELLEYLAAQNGSLCPLRSIARELKRGGKSVAGIVACLEPWHLVQRITMDGSCYARITVQGHMALKAGSYAIH